MRRLLPILALAVAVTVPLVRAAETIERVVAIVNSQTILLSEWDTAARLEALLNHRPLESMDDASRRATFDRMIDQELLRGEMENSSLARCTPQDVATKLREIRQQYPEASSDIQWNAILSRYGVTQEELESAIAAELDGLHLVDFRLRSSAQPDTAQIERYYHTVYEPAMRGKQAKPAPLAEVTPQIREILTQQKLTDLTASWLQTLRAQANIQMNIPSAETNAKP
jgi:hypothetical protein